MLLQSLGEGQVLAAGRRELELGSPVPNLEHRKSLVAAGRVARAQHIPA
jgi:hypothetical protein